MKFKRFFKIVIDAAMTVLFLILMAYHVTENKQHEWLGVALFVLFIIHHILNAKWYASLFKGKYSAVRILMMSVNFPLFVSMVGMMVSGIIISSEVFDFLNIRAGMLGHRLHMLSVSWGFPLMAMHIGLHWGAMLNALIKKLPFKSRPAAIVMRVIVILTSAYGAYAFVVRQFPDRMFLRVHFVFFDFEEPAIFFFLDYFCVLILFASISYYLSKLAKPRKYKEELKV